MAFPVDPQLLLVHDLIESSRIECKAGWNPESIMQTICAFANDIHDWGGGYIFIGVAEEHGRPALPPVGVSAEHVDRIQKELVELCHKIRPSYSPVISPEVIDGKHVVAVWVPGGEARPYKAPATLATKERQYHYYVRIGSITKRAQGDLETELLRLAKGVPFDDRVNHHAEVDHLQLRLILGHLQTVGSTLFDTASTLPFSAVCENLRIVSGPPEHLRPRNVGLLCFTDDPDAWFPGTWIEVVYMPHGRGADYLRERKFVGPLDAQLRSALEYISTHFIDEAVIKHADRAEATRYFTYPYGAVEEALANAIYHRGYDVREPVQVHITADQMTITSYPGPVMAFARDEFQKGLAVARRYRNRRIGEFLKALRMTEGHGTGISKILNAMHNNGSSAPRFEWDDERTYFTTVLPRRALPVDLEITNGSTLEVAPTSANNREVDILEFCKTPQTRSAIMHHVNMRDRMNFLRRHLNPMLTQGLLRATLAASPSAPNQKYFTTPKGRRKLLA